MTFAQLAGVKPDTVGVAVACRHHHRRPATDRAIDRILHGCAAGATAARLMLMTLARFAPTAGTPATVPPEAQVTASAISAQRAAAASQRTHRQNTRVERHAGDTCRIVSDCRCDAGDVRPVPTGVLRWRTGIALIRGHPVAGIGRIAVAPAAVVGH